MNRQEWMALAAGVSAWAGVMLAGILAASDFPRTHDGGVASWLFIIADAALAVGYGFWWFRQILGLTDV